VTLAIRPAAAKAREMLRCTEVFMLASFLRVMK